MLGAIPMSKQVVVDIQKEVNPHFRPVWTTNKPYNILRGGRNSFKSSVIAIQLAYMMLQYITKGEKANVVVIRKVANTIRDSVLLKIQWGLEKFGLLDQDRKSTRLNSSHVAISYAVFCLKKKK